MDHSHHAAMDHSHMDHGDMGGGGHDMPMCSMNVRLQPILNQQEPPPQLIRISSLSIQMLFTWDTTNLCIVFPSWRVTGTLSLIVSLLAVVALTAGYEAIREVSRRYEERLEQNVREAPRKFLPSAVFLCVFCRQGLVVWVTSKPRLRIPFYANAKTTSNEAHSLLLWQAMPSRRKRRRARRSRLRCTACRCFIRSSSCEFYY